MVYAMFITCSMLLLSYGLGHLLASPFLKNSFKSSFYDVFVKFTVGTLAIVTVYSLIQTRGNTIHFGILILGLLYVRLYQLQTSQSLFQSQYRMPNWKSLGLPLLSACFSVAYLGWYYYAEPVNNILHFDEGYYAFTAGKMGMFGAETNDTVIPAMGFNPAAPYHYFETWLVHLVAKTFRIFPMEALSVVVKAQFMAILYTGMLALVQKFTHNVWFYVLAFPAMYISPILLDYENIKQASSNVHQAKLTIAAIAMVWFLLLLLYKHRYWYFPLLLMPFINITYAPVMFSALAVYFLVQAMYKKSMATFFKHFGILMIPALALFLFYVLQPKSNPYHIKTELNLFLPLYHLPYFKRHY